MFRSTFRMGRVWLAAFCFTLLELVGCKRLESLRSSRAATHLRSSLLAFRSCFTGHCPATNPTPSFPLFSCPHGVGDDVIDKIEAFISFAHGGSPWNEHPAQPLVLGMQNFMCPIAYGGGVGNLGGSINASAGLPAPPIFISVAIASRKTVCIQMRLPNRPDLCGCIDDGIESVKHKRFEIVTHDWVDHFPDTCEILLTKSKLTTYLYDENFVSSAPKDKNTLCAVSWNLGREYDKHVAWLQGVVNVGGVGLSGLEGNELSNGLDMLLRECEDASIVVLGLQEGAEHRLTQRIQALKSKGSRKLRANAFAGVRPWGNNIKAIGDVQGLAQHFSEAVKEGVMVKYGQVFGGAHSRMVVLTTENVLTFNLDKVKNEIPIGSPTNALELGTPEFKIESLGESCISLTGMQLVEAGKGEHRCDIKSYKMCAETGDERAAWLASIQLVHWRAAGLVMKEGVLDFVNPDGSHIPCLAVVTSDRIMPFSFIPGTDDLANGFHAIQLGLSEFRVATTLEPLCMTVSGQELAYTYDGIRTGKVILYKMCARSEEEIGEWVTKLQNTALARSIWEEPEEYVVYEGRAMKHGQWFGSEKERLVRLTSHQLLTNAIDDVTGEAVGLPTNALELPSITVEAENSTEPCMLVAGLEKGSSVKFKMCVSSLPLRNKWIDAITSERDSPRQVTVAISDRFSEEDMRSLTTRLNLILESTTRTESLFNEAVGHDISSSVVAAMTGTVIAKFELIEILSNTKTCLHGRDAWAISMAMHTVDWKSNQDLKGLISETLDHHGFKVLDAQMSIISQEVGPIRVAEKTTGAKVHSLPFTKGVSLAVLSDIEPSEVELFTVDFSFASENRKSPNTHWLTRMKQQFRDKMLSTTADKGGAIVRAVFGGKALCFASCHLDAGNADKRHQQAQLMSDSLAALKCDAQLWMGDFNTRPTHCCPWKEIELSIAHGLYRHIRNLTWNHDDFPSMSKGYEEMPPIPRPTFHKRFKRLDQDECAAHEFKNVSNEDHRMFEKASLSWRADLVHKTHTNSKREAKEAISNASDVIAHGKVAMAVAAEASVAAAKAEENYKSMLFKMNQFVLEEFHGECESTNQHTLCWGGHKTREACEKGECYNILDKSHCPGYTDRVIYKRGSVLEPLTYYSVESRVEADHTPVVATFALSLD